MDVWCAILAGNYVAKPDLIPHLVPTLYKVAELACVSVDGGGDRRQEIHLAAQERLFNTGQHVVWTVLLQLKACNRFLDVHFSR